MIPSGEAVPLQQKRRQQWRQNNSLLVRLNGSVLNRTGGQGRNPARALQSCCGSLGGCQLPIAVMKAMGVMGTLLEIFCQ
jgi:hypothetical protein